MKISGAPPIPVKPALQVPAGASGKVPLTGEAAAKAASALALRSPGLSGPASAAGFPAAGSHGLEALVHSLGLPAGKLSASLVSFFRFFSLTLDPKMLNSFRRDIALLPASFRGAPEAAGLAAAAAAAKGLKLSAAALADYAAAIDPEARRDSSGGEGPERRSEGGSSQGEPPQENAGGMDGRSGGGGGSNSGGSGGRRKEQPELGKQAEAVRQRAAAAMEMRPALDFINRIPDKNGRRWVVIPFSYTEKEVELQVSLRILLKERPEGNPALSTLDSAERMALDISSEKRRWFFILEPSANGGMELSFSVEPPPEPEHQTRRELVKRLGSAQMGLTQMGSVQVFPLNEAPLFSDSRDELLRSFNKEV